MLRYVVRRIVWGAFLLVVVTALTFVIFTVFPSADPAALRAGRQATPELIAQIRHSLGLDKPLYTQYWLFLKNLVLHFDLGYSYWMYEDRDATIFPGNHIVTIEPVRGTYSARSQVFSVSARWRK